MHHIRIEMSSGNAGASRCQPGADGVVKLSTFPGQGAAMKAGKEIGLMLQVEP
jgi:hypothetical protein